MITYIEPIEPLGNLLLRDVLQLVREYTKSNADDRMLRLCSNIVMINLFNSLPEAETYYGTAMRGTIDKLIGIHGTVYLNSPVKNVDSLYGVVTNLNQLSGMRRYVSAYYENKNTIESTSYAGSNKFGDVIQSVDPAYISGAVDNLLIPSHIISLINGVISNGKTLHFAPWPELLYRKQRPAAPFIDGSGFWSRSGDSLAILQKNLILSGSVDIHFTRNIILDNLLDIDTILSGYNANIDIPEVLFNKYFELFAQSVVALDNRMVNIPAQPNGDNNGTTDNNRPE